MGVIVETGSGRVEGEKSGGVAVFRGVPYARPPVGDLRFRAPQPAEPWAGVRDATRFGAISPQNPSPLEALFAAAQPAADEDCLTLNVWTPGPDDRRRPVMVWIHGGAFVTGSGSTPWYDGTRFAADHDVVVVTVNYRLGALGFLYLAELAGDGFADSGNAGILDQVAALNWVRDNIAAFGGDPGNVTVFGESAGGMSVGTLLGMPAAGGLFRRAILQSGAGHNARTAESATQVAQRVLGEIGIEPGRAREVVSVPLDRLLAAQLSVAAAYVTEGLAFQPVIDDVNLPRLPVESVAAGDAAGVDVLIGTNQDEWNLFAVLDPSFADLDEVRAQRMATRFIGNRGPEVLAAYRSERPESPLTDVVCAIASDAIFRIPAIRLAEAQKAAGGRPWMYLFTWPTPAFGGRLGSCHALEIPFVFNNLDRPGASVFTGDGAPPGVADAMNAAWAAFARNGDPTQPCLPAWPGYDAERRATMVIDVQSQVVDDPMGSERALWEGVL